MATRLLDQINAPTVLSVEFEIKNAPGALTGKNLSTSIPLEKRIAAGDYIPAKDSAGAAIVLSATTENPMAINLPGKYRITAASLAAGEVVIMDQSKAQ